MTKFSRNRLENVWEIDVFVESLHTNFDQNRLNVMKFRKNRVFKQLARKDQYGCKMTSSTKWLSRNCKILRFYHPKIQILVFIPKIPIFLGKPLKKSKILEIWKNGIYVIEPHVYYLHAKLKGNPSIFGTPIVQKPSKTICIPKIPITFFWKF